MKKYFKHLFTEIAHALLSADTRVLFKITDVYVYTDPLLSPWVARVHIHIRVQNKNLIYNETVNEFKNFILLCQRIYSK